MLKLKFELIGDTNRGETNLGTFEYELKVDGKDWVIEKDMGHILIKDKSTGRYFLERMAIRFKGEDMDK